MSPTVVQPRSLRVAAVFSGALWYSNWGPSSDQTVPTSPVGGSLPSSSRMCGTSDQRLPDGAGVREPILVSRSP